ncbi:hypothetical protein H9Q69_001572 [Fusarium xylarioides]|uniref:Uncharacterized protein n=1 Tax=Fusarium xylarioides TaxID=221167 RepID=A0A9P7LLQ6_9HYPO|nr:hypothetical protein H9Q70_001848 [Fusarium xylarioides]KAG5767220.1 hypothetical protein H9Q72_004733 [Fusarium xylarioides]KAG5781984.1 hypothetical protein H9Q73_004356 [Fusarium xylarioides]KAG5799452.1 hypothetical protein H9Q69_001572 [Fusarium xylarioides]KAG5815343.1 hypothetical protein H9Q71_002811 [Fusarium xylarioides]
MAFEKRIRSRMAQSVISTDTTTDDSFEELCSAPSLSRREYSEDNLGSSKFAEAMKNPDWRRRDGFSASDLTDTTNSTNQASPHSREVPNNGTEGGYISHMRNGNISPWTFIDNSNQFQPCLCGSETDIKHSNVSSTNQEHDNVQAADAMGGLCTIRLNVDLAGGHSKDRQLRVLQVSPLPSYAANPQEHRTVVPNIDREAPIAYVQRVVRKQRRAMQRTDNTNGERCRTPHHIFPTEAGNESELDKERTDKARRAVLKDPAVANIGSAHAKPQPKVPSGLSSPAEQTRKSEELERRKAAFMKILQKLQKGSKNETENNKRDTNRPFISHGCPWGSKSSQRPSQSEQQSSDSGIGSLYSDPRRNKDSSNDSGIRIDSDVLTHGLNPRAREFLSFKRSFPAAPQTLGIVNFPEDDILKSMILSQTENGSENTGRNTIRTASHNMDGISVPVLQSDIGANSTESTPVPLVNTADSAKQDPGEVNYSSKTSPPAKYGSPGDACGPPVRNILTPGVLPGLGLGIMPTPATFGNTPSLSMFSPLLQQYHVASGHFMGTSAAPQILFNPTSGSSCYQPRLHPVPKPTNPDPIQQQQYEEYIEWRKAHEPGYALACKGRQQRRALRGIATQPMSMHHASYEGAQMVQ